jgi:hypothetical protein
VTTATTGALATLDFPVAFVYSSTTSTTSTTPVGTGTVSVNQEYAPTPASGFFAASTGGAASSSLPIPRFADTGTAKTFATITSCRTVLLWPYVVSGFAGFDTGIAVADTSADPFGTIAQTGTCAFNFYGSGAPTTTATACTGGSATGTYCTPNITPTAPFAGLASAMIGTGANFQGYSIAVCNFQYAHGYGYTAYQLGTASATTSSYLALVIPDPATTTSGRPATSGETTTSAEVLSH